jgi:hypothetical protein
MTATLEDKDGERSIKVNRIFPEDLRTYFVANFIVQHEPENFILSLFELWPPIILGETKEEKLEVVKSIDSIDAKCVARIVLTPTRMREFIEVITENFKAYEKKITGAKSTED